MTDGRTDGTDGRIASALCSGYVVIALYEKSKTSVARDGLSLRLSKVTTAATARQAKADPCDIVHGSARNTSDANASRL